VQAGGGNRSSGSTGTAQVSGTEASPSVTLTPSGGESTQAGTTAGVAGSGNSAGDSTGALQVGGGNTATGSTGSAQSGSPTLTPGLGLGLAAPPGTPDLVGVLSLAGAGSAAGLASAVPASIATITGASAPAGGPASVATAAVVPPAAPGATAPVRTQGAGATHGVLGAARTLAGNALSGVLPFTGLGLALWVAVGLALVAAGAGLWRRSAPVR
jgi:hypothetical protein